MCSNIGLWEDSTKTPELKRCVHQHLMGTGVHSWVAVLLRHRSLSYPSSKWTLVLSLDEAARPFHIVYASLLLGTFQSIWSWLIDFIWFPNCGRPLQSITERLLPSQVVLIVYLFLLCFIPCQQVTISSPTMNQITRGRTRLPVREQKVPPEQQPFDTHFL